MADKMFMELEIKPTFVGLEESMKPVKDQFSGAGGGAGGGSGVLTELKSINNVIRLSLGIDLVGKLVGMFDKLIEAILAPLVFIGKLIGMIISPIQGIIDALSIVIDIIAVPFKMLSAFFMTLIVPFFQIGLVVSRMLMLFFQGFIDKYNEAFATRVAASPENPMAAQAGAIAEASVYWIGSIFIGLENALLKGMVDIFSYLFLGFVQFFAQIGLISSSGLTNFVKNLSEVRTSLKTTIDSGTSEHLKSLGAVAKAYGDNQQAVAKVMEDSFKKIEGIGSQTEASMQSVYEKQATDQTETQKRIEQEATTPTILAFGKLQDSSGKTGRSLQSLEDECDNMKVLLSGGYGVNHHLGRLAVNADSAANKLSAFNFAMDTAKGKLDSLKEIAPQQQNINILGIQGNFAYRGAQYTGT
jgi:hypothetical protein